MKMHSPEECTESRSWHSEQRRPQPAAPGLFVRKALWDSAPRECLAQGTCVQDSLSDSRVSNKEAKKIKHQTPNFFVYPVNVPSFRQNNYFHKPQLESYRTHRWVKHTCYSDEMAKVLARKGGQRDLPSGSVSPLHQSCLWEWLLC